MLHIFRYAQVLTTAHVLHVLNSLNSRYIAAIRLSFLILHDNVLDF